MGAHSHHSSLPILLLHHHHLSMPHSKTLFFFFTLITTVFSDQPPPSTTSDGVALLSFKSKADLDNKLHFNPSVHFCKWEGVKCSQGRVIRLFLPNCSLRGTFPPNSLSLLPHLRTLSLSNNSLHGPLPPLPPLLHSLLLHHNLFSGPIPPHLLRFDRLSSLRLDSNRFNGTLPPFNQSTLLFFNVSSNNLSGPIPVTPTLSRFKTTSFLGNPGLCGDVIHKACDSPSPSPSPSSDNNSSVYLGQSAESEGNVVVSSVNFKKHKSSDDNNNNNGLILGSTIGASILFASFLGFIALVKKRRSDLKTPKMDSPAVEVMDSKIEGIDGGDQHHHHHHHCRRNLVFCCGEEQLCTLDQLMGGSAELLGRGSIGTTYKVVVVDGRLSLTVKRLDAGKIARTSGELFERHMEMVGQLRHPNLVPVRAYFQAESERLVIFDYQSNGSLFNLIHGSRSARAKPLHWTSCLKIAEDIAHGLAYIHQTSRLIHGNLKSSNVLLGVDFEARVTDYSLSLLADSSSSDDPDSAAYKAPETRNTNRPPTSKSDVYTYGVLLLELLTSKYASQHPFLVPMDLQDWVRAMRNDYGAEDKQLGMLTEVASICTVISPEQRPAMRQVLKMIQEIKKSVTLEGNTSTGFS